MPRRNNHASTPPADDRHLLPYVYGTPCARCTKDMQPGQPVTRDGERYSHQRCVRTRKR